MMLKLNNFNFKKQTYVDKIVEIIEYRIISGKLRPNSKVSEWSLAKEFNVSRNPAREALLRLEEMKLILKTHTGRVVKGFSIDEFRENYELKIIVEAYCGMQGADKATAQDISNIRGILEKTRTLLSSEDHKNRLSLNSRFHESIVLCSQNKKLIEIYRTQTRQFGWPKFFPSLKLPRAKKSYEDHLMIFDAFVNKDGPKVRELSEKHQKNTMEIILENLQKEIPC